MKWLDRIFKSFSSRPTEDPLTSIPDTFRKRVVMWCMDVFGNERYSMINHTGEFWIELHKYLRYKVGDFSVSHEHSGSPNDECLSYLQHCDTEDFLAFVEYIFRFEFAPYNADVMQEMVEEINYLLQVDGLPYYLTDYVQRIVPDERHGIGGNFVDTDYPRVIFKGNEVVHNQAIIPTLNLLQRPHFKPANDEFLDALKDFRIGDYGDCLTKCNSAFESVMKILCDRRGWSYNQTDTANTLVRIILDNSSLDSYFETLLIIVATLRNRLSTSHGSGTTDRSVPQHIAQYAINATASAILLLVYESGEQ